MLDKNLHKTMLFQCSRRELICINIQPEMMFVSNVQNY